MPLRRRKWAVFDRAIQTGQAPEYPGRGNAGASTRSTRRCYAHRCHENDNKRLGRTLRRSVCRHRIVQRTHTARSHRGQLTDRAMSAAASMRSGVDSEQPRDSIPFRKSPRRGAMRLIFPSALHRKHNNGKSVRYGRLGAIRRRNCGISGRTRKVSTSSSRCSPGFV